jgi:hypothetical protein
MNRRRRPGGAAGDERLPDHHHRSGGQRPLLGCGHRAVEETFEDVPMEPFEGWSETGLDY